MRGMLKKLIVPTLTLAIGLLVGFALGQRQGFGMGKVFMAAETNGMLSLHVEVASSVRVGDTERALRYLDTFIDSAVVNMHAQPAPHEIPTAMREAKVYRRAVPPTGPNAVSVVGALKDVPEPEGAPYSAPERQRTGLGRLVTRTGGQ